MIAVTYRVFRGDETRQVDASGRRADPQKWYYEPEDYDGDVLWSNGYDTPSAAVRAWASEVES